MLKSCESYDLFKDLVSEGKDMDVSNENRKSSVPPGMPRRRRHRSAFKAVGVFLGTTLMLFLANVGSISGYSVRDFLPPTENTQPNASADAIGESGGSNWGPGRSIYSLASGGSPYPAYDCIIDNPNYGDERAFATIREASSDDYTSRLEVKEGTEYQIRIYVNNCGPDTEIDSKSSWIQDAHAKLLFSSGLRKNHAATAYLSGSNVTEVYSNIFLWSDRAFRVTYRPGSAVLCSNAHPCPQATADSCPTSLPCPGFVVSSELLSTQGFRLGYEDMDGNLRPGYQYVNFLFLNIGVEFE